MLGKYQKSDARIFNIYELLKLLLINYEHYFLYIYPMRSEWIYDLKWRINDGEL